MQMKISVIIPVYNRAAAIRRAIDSVLAQSYSAHEIIVVDDASTDDTPYVLQQYAEKIRLIALPENCGVSSARNAGIQAASGDWLAFLDSDDEWLPHKLKMAVEFHQQHPDYLIFQTEEIWIRNGRRVNPRQKHKKPQGWIFKPSLALCLVSPSAVVIHRSLLDNVGMFDESLPVCEDYDLWLRISRKYPVGLDKRFGIIKYGGHADQLSHKYWGMDRFRLKAMEKQLKDDSTPAELRLALLQEMIKKTTVLLNGAHKRNNEESRLWEKRLEHWLQEKEILERNNF